MVCRWLVICGRGEGGEWYVGRSAGQFHCCLFSTVVSLLRQHNLLMLNCLLCSKLCKHNVHSLSGMWGVRVVHGRGEGDEECGVWEG